jgi:putative FmdB family regulatory protein
MPIYEYRCTLCGHELEALQKFSDAPLVACPACTKDSLVKLVSAAGFQLKGSGWYATDFKGSGSKPAAKADSGDAKPAAAKPEAKSEAATPAAAPTAATGTGSTSS